MSSALKHIEDQALHLSVTEREILANHLLQSIHHQDLNEVESEWLQLAEKRFNNLMTGSDSGISEAVFFKRFGIE